MDGSTNLANGNKSLFGFVGLGILNWFTPGNIDITFKILTGIGAVIVAVLTGRYYWLAAKVKKKELAEIESRTKT